MHSRKDGWGLAVFLLSSLMIGSILFASNRLAPAVLTRLSPTLPFIGMALSVFCVVLGHLSYPRVHNLKVFLLCYLTGLLGMFYFLLPVLGIRRTVSVPVILLFSQANLFIALVFPSYTKYRATRFITWFMVLVELSCLLILLFLDSTSTLLRIVERNTGVLPWVMVFWPLLILVFSFLKMKREFKLGGVITGCSYFQAVGFLVLMKRIPLPESLPLLFAGSVLYLVVGIMVHWFCRMEHRVSYDPLLQIYNRNFCSRIIEEQTRLNTAPPFGVAMVDIDHFKKVNDTWGHQAGDSVLIGVSQTIQREVVPDGVVCRYGGEELAVFFPRMEGRDILPIMEKVRKSVESLKVAIGKRRHISVTISCGISHRASTTQSIVDVIHSADRALYRAKESGRNRVINSR